MDITTLAGAGLVASLLVQLAKLLLGKIDGKWGATVTQVVLLFASFCVAGIGVALKLLPPEIIETTIGVAVSGMAIYEICYKAIYQNLIKGKVE